MVRKSRFKNFFVTMDKSPSHNFLVKVTESNSLRVLEALEFNNIDEADVEYSLICRLFRAAEESNSQGKPEVGYEILNNRLAARIRSAEESNSQGRPEVGYEALDKRLAALESKVATNVDSPPSPGMAGYVAVNPKDIANLLNIVFIDIAIAASGNRRLDKKAIIINVRELCQISLEEAKLIVDKAYESYTEYMNLY